MAKYIEGDIHDVIKTLETSSIDLIYTNPPFGTTENKWDKSLNWDKLWLDIWRVLKPNGVVVIHASKPFSYQLIKSQTPKYNYNWIKTKPTNFLKAKIQPLRKVEEIFIFYKKKHTYNPQMVGNEKRMTGSSSPTTYYGNRLKKQTDATFHIGKYPTDVLEFKQVVRGGKTICDDMIDFFIKTYSNENDLVLDMTTHNDVVGNRVTALKRKFIGVDINLPNLADFEKKLK